MREQKKKRHKSISTDKFMIFFIHFFYTKSKFYWRVILLENFLSENENFENWILNVLLRLILNQKKF